jgi:microcystin-dependent protein
VATQNIGLTQPANGSDVGTWDVPVNGNMGIIDQTFGSTTSVSLAGGNVTLSVAQSAYFMITVTGTLVGNTQLILPSSIGGRRIINNQTSGAFTVTVLNGAGDTGGGVVVGQGFQTPVVLTGAAAYYDAYAATPPGTILETGFTNPPPGFLLCYGQTVSRSTYAQLWSAAQAYGWAWGNGDGSTTFTLPDFRGIITAGADNMGGSAAGRLSGYSVGTSGGNQAHTLVASELPVTAYSDTGHGHSVSDPGHAHAFGNNIVAASFSSNAGGTIYLSIIPPGSSLSTNVAPTNISIQTGRANITNAGGGNSHSIVQPTAAVNKMIRY